MRTYLKSREAAEAGAAEGVGVRGADDLFQGIADRLGGEFDGWEAAI